MYLKHNVKLAPYIWQWYAWSHLIAPHTAATNIVSRHMEIMKSFIDYPEMHFEAINTFPTIDPWQLFAGGHQTV